MEHNNEVFRQDLSKETRPGGPFLIQLLFKEPIKMPDKKSLVAVLQKHLGEVECFSYNGEMAGIAAQKYRSQFKDGAVPPQLMIVKCDTFSGEDFDPFLKSQMWDCIEERDRIFAECRYQVLATDMLAAGLPAKERAELDMDFMEALAELYPTCEAFYFQNSGKLFLAGEIRGHKIPREDRFVRFAVNARFFNIQGTNDQIVDTVGMRTLFLPDIQYHFHTMDPNWVVNHAYNIASYLLERDNPIKDDDTIDGVENGKFSREAQWRCRYEDALIQPVREVIDICMGEYASGKRNDKE